MSLNRVLQVDLDRKKLQSQYVEMRNELFARAASCFEAVPGEIQTRALAHQAHVQAALQAGNSRVPCRISRAGIFSFMLERAFF